MSEKVSVFVDVFGNVGVNYQRRHVDDTSTGTITSCEMAGWFEESRVSLDREPATAVIPLQWYEQIDKY